MVWKNLNYTGQSTGQKNKTGGRTAGIKQLRASLSHTLRTVSKSDLEFNKDLSSENLIFFNGKYIKLDELSIKEREDIAAAIYQPVQNNLKNEDTLRELKREFEIHSRKIKRMIKSEENQEITEMLKDILSTDIFIKPEQVGNLSEVINNSDVKRKNQKIKTINQFIKASNKLNEHRDKTDLDFHCRSVSIRETFWKFPVNQGIDNVKPEDYMDIIKNFYELALPNHPVKLIVYHGDEVLHNKKNNSVSSAGVHPHIFVDGKNKKTGKYDLINSEYDLVNKYLKKNYPDQPQLVRGDNQTAQRMGEIFQEIVYKYVNNQLKKRNYDITVEVSEKTQERKLKNLELKADTTKPKADRAYNLINHSIETIEKNKKLLNKQKVAYKNNEKLLNKQKEVAEKNKNSYIQIKDAIANKQKELVFYEKMVSKLKSTFDSAINNIKKYIKSKDFEDLNNYVDDREEIKALDHSGTEEIIDFLIKKENQIAKTPEEKKILSRSGSRSNKYRP